MLARRMKRIAVTLALVGSVGLVTLAAQRIVSHDAQPYLKQVFPAAVAFSPHQGTPLHYKAYGVDPKTNPSAPPIGLVFWSTDLVPHEHGYHVTLAVDAMTDIDADAHHNSIRRIFPRLGETGSTADVLALLEG